MKKTLLSIGLFVASIVGVNAQTTTHFNVDFSDVTVLEDWYNFDLDGDEDLIGIQTTSIPNSLSAGFVGGFGYSFSYDNDLGPLFPDNALVTQAVTIPANSTANFTFKVGALDTGGWHQEHYSIYVITDANFQGAETIGDFINLLVNSPLSETLTTRNAVSKTVSLNSYAGQTIRIVFRHHDVSNEFAILFDDFKVESTLSANKHLEEVFNISPNPTSDIVNISSSLNTNLTQVNVIDLNGRTVKAFNLGGVANAQINIADLSSGVYMLNITSEEGTTTKKIVKN